MTETLFRSSDRGLERWESGGWTLADFIDCGDGNYYPLNGDPANVAWVKGFATCLLLCMGCVAAWAVFITGGH